MSQLIQMRQRITTIETIKKITHAMRLIAMSSHANLKNSQLMLRNYTSSIRQLLAIIATQVPNWPSLLTSHTPSKPHHATIIVSAQKGLCGNFNTALFNLAKTTIDSQNLPTMIAIGKKAADFITHTLHAQPHLFFESLHARNYLDIAQKLVTHLLHTAPAYTTVTVYSNQFKSFFIQLPHATNLIPGIHPNTLHNFSPCEYAWDIPPAQMFPLLYEQYVVAQLQQLLFESLLAEQAARFISMDNATRNANKLLEQTKLYYNKLRQAKITKEIIELSSSFNSEH